MKYKYFYTDYCEDKTISGSEPWEAEKSQILHSMDCVLHMPNNFLGILNNKDQCLQFMVQEDSSVLIDIPITENGVFLGSKSKAVSLADCLTLVQELEENQDFTNILPPESLEVHETANGKNKKPWWKFW
ncbi:hypothetical protein [uncultured Cocleimonas sp.]|uniref:hypothetical protein n=1 Tax=uncultured Cocleimonas sp. TaxID=1051587 RepID=UPI002614B653|nr:hypothetical protein [uncultured Cocleimonas sp.]